MLGFFRRLFARRDAFGYTPGERAIFVYWDGQRQRQGDPLAIHRALIENPDFDLTIDPGLSAVPTNEGVRAKGRIVAAVRKAFGVPAFEAGGLLDAECLELFISFGSFVTQMTEASRPLASSPTPTPASAYESATVTSAASGSNVSESSVIAAAS